MQMWLITIMLLHLNTSSSSANLICDTKADETKEGVKITIH